MKQALILRTNTVIAEPALGFNKFILNYPGGLEHVLETGYRQGLRIEKKSLDVLVKVKVYNGKLMTIGNNADYLVPFETGTETDEHGNVVTSYLLDDSYAMGYLGFSLKCTVGTTRAEVYDCSYHCGVGSLAQQGARDYAAVADFRQFAFLSCPQILCSYLTCAGDLIMIKNRDDIEHLEIPGTQVTGDIANLVRSAAKSLSYISVAYDTGVYGELTTVLDAMKSREDVKGRSFTWYFFNSQVKYKGEPINQGEGRVIVFDNNGNYSMPEIDT